MSNPYLKEHWQMHPGPSNPRVARQTWTCSVCKKELSSKRSYTEHMNIHNKTRPFRCESCSYAAASQMTLHRHKLRNHTPKTEWGYRCPYCEDAYMEPAGYQQHVQQRHPGKSATYGCPFRMCKFTSKSQRHFREHLVKHDRSDKIDGGVDPCALSNQQLVRYMINDEIGAGFERRFASPVRSMKVQARRPAGIAPKMYVTPSMTSSSSLSPSSILPRVMTSSSREHHQQKVVWRVQKVPIRSQAPPNFHQIPAEPLPQTYDQIPREFEVQLEEDEELSEFEGIQPFQDDFDDDGPPVLENQQGERNAEVGEEIEVEEVEEDDSEWIQEVPNPEIGVFPNGFIDEELD